MLTHFLSALFSSDGFVPHIHCYLDRTGVVWLHVTSDFLIGLSYLVISLTLYSLVRRVKFPFNRMFISFGVFIAACGLSHFMEIWTLWHPTYWLSGAIKAITAVASVSTGIYLYRTKPEIILLSEINQEAEESRIELQRKTAQLIEANRILQKEIVERKKAEEALKQSEESLRVRGNTLRSIFDSSPMMMGVIDLEGDEIRHISDNKSASEFFEKPVRGKLAIELGVSREIVSLWVDHYKRTEASRAPIHFEYWHPSLPQSRCFSVTVSFIDYTPQGYSRFSYIVQDITKIREAERILQQANDFLELRVSSRTDDLEKLNSRLQQEVEQQKRTQEALEKSQEEFETLANNISQLTWMADNKGKIFWYNQKWYDYTGTSADQVQGWGWKIVHHPEHLERATEKWMKHLQEGVDWEDTFPLQGKDGSYRWFLSRALPIRDSAGKILRWFGTNTDITEQRKANEKISDLLKREADARQTLELALSSGKIGTFDWDLVQGSHIWSEQMQKFFGFELGKSPKSLTEVIERIHPDDREWMTHWVEDLFQKRQGYHEVRYRTLRPDGSVVWLDVRGHAFYDSEGAPVRVLAIVIDITQTKLAEQAIRESEAKLRAIIEGTDDLICAQNLEGRFIASNASHKKEFQRIFGKELVLGMQMSDLLAHLPQEQEKAVAVWNRALTGEPFVLTEEYGDDARSRCFYELRYSPIRDSEGNLIGATELARNVTRERLVRLELQEGEKRFRLLADAMPQIVWTTKPDGLIDYLNAQWYAYTGLNPDLEIQEDRNQVIHFDDRLKNQAAWQKAQKEISRYEVELRLQGKEGQYRWFMGRAVPVIDSLGRVQAWFGTCTDIHDQKLVQRELEGAVRARDHFLSIASHELKTPLTSLQLLIQLRQRNLKRKIPEMFTPEKIQEDLKEQYECVNRIGRLVDDILDVSRISEGKLRFQFEEVDLCEIVNGVLSRFQVTAESEGVEILLEVCQPIVGKWDRFRLEQVFLNLLTNALKYGKKKPIHVRVESKDNHAVLTVRDEGMGIQTEDIHRIFQRFERAISADEVSGLGLGLYISQEIVQRHHGNIHVKSKFGSGSEFIVILPQKAELEK